MINSVENPDCPNSNIQDLQGRKVELQNYVSYTRNRNDKAAGGISTSILDEEAAFCVGIDEGKESNEFIVTRHDQFVTPINVINFYGQQECRTSKDIIEKHWNEVEEVMSKAESRQEWVLFVGDANRHLGKVIPGNDEKVSFGGTLVQEFLETERQVGKENFLQL